MAAGDRLVLADRTVDLETGAVSTGDTLRPMELRVLRYLAQRPDAVVPKGALLAEVWGYADGVRTNTVHTTVRRLRRAIERDPDQPVHLVTEGRAGFRLAGASVRAGAPTRLPRPVPLVGREAERAALDGGEPLVVLVGPSGIGKTALAAAWATEQARAARVWWVDAAGVLGAEDLAHRLAAALGTTADALDQGLVGTAGVVDDLDPAALGADGLAALQGWSGRRGSW